MTFREPENCRFRDSILAEGHCCRRAQQIVGEGASVDYAVSRDACEACCRAQSPDPCNPVVGSLVCAATSRMLRSGVLGSDLVVRLREAQGFAARYLEGVRGDGETSPPEQPQTKLPTDTRPPRSNAKGLIGLAGRNSWQGLGYQNRDIVRQLPVSRWLIPSADRVGPVPSVGECRVEFIPEDAGRRTLESWLRGLDHLLFVETPCFPELPRLARRLGITVHCVPNWEWLHPGLVWLDDVDRMLCPTEHTYRILDGWKRRYGYGWELHCVPWPVDVSRWPFRQRKRCHRFLFVNGLGGVRPACSDGTPAGYRRKGLELVLEAAALAPEISILVLSQSEDLPPAPPNVEVRSGPLDHCRLYDDGDVCLQPSHWEGLGLPLLECQAAGMPLVTTDAAPMNEYCPLRVLPVWSTEAVRLTPQRWIPAQRLQPAELAETLRSLHQTDISAASRRARRFVRQRHDWPLWRSELLRLITRPAMPA